MKKILLVMAALFGCAIVSFAQNSYVATLQHEGEFTHYYGSGALTSAYNAAETGDIITLSPGRFTFSGTFSKAITLRGANGGLKTGDWTIISDGVSFKPTDATKETTIEGVRFESTISISGQGTLKFIKNVIFAISAYTGPKVRFYNNAIYSIYFYDGSPDYLFYNCFISEPRCSSNVSETTTSFVNCVISYHTFMSGPFYKSNAQENYYLNFYNCIFNCIDNSGNYMSLHSLPQTATAFYCLTIKGALFKNLISKGNNYAVNSPETVFVTYRDNHETDELFELTDAAKGTYIGTDGTQIGMQGGSYPYTTDVQYPVITKFSSDSQTNKEGVLNIEVEVDGK